MSLSAEVFGSDSWIHKLTNIGGLGVPGWLDRSFGGGNDPQYNSIGDMARQTAEEGGTRVVVWGRVRPIGGNLIYCQKPQKRWVVSYQEAGGKGGDSEEQEVWTQRVYRTYAFGVCEGPISRFVRIWRNNKLVYDARGNAWGEKNNPAFLRGHRLYLGGWDQLPCPELQAIWGTDIPAHRGTAYMVAVNRDLTNFGGGVPQYQFEVERAEGVYLTSKPYAIEDIEAIDSLPLSVKIPPYVAPDNMQTLPMEIVSGVLRDPQIVYENWPAEAIDTGIQITEGQLRNAIISYSLPPEGIDASGLQVTAGEIRVALLSYTNWPAEAIDASGLQIIGGTLT